MSAYLFVAMCAAGWLVSSVLFAIVTTFVVLVARRISALIAKRQPCECGLLARTDCRWRESECSIAAQHGNEP